MKPSKLKMPINVDTAFEKYSLFEIIGEGGAGRVYAGTSAAGNQVAVKLLSDQSTEKRRRFKNEIGFLLKNSHPNIVGVLDYGLAENERLTGPFYVMERYDSNLRPVLNAQCTPEKSLQIFSKILDGVEAAHFKGVTHRDLKPENILVSTNQNLIAVADFGIARFTSEMLLTDVATSPNTRLANFQYAAPEQRAAGRNVDERSDIYSLGLILNELFTRNVPHGTDFSQIADLYPEFAFLDRIVGEMIRQDPRNRPSSIGVVKGLIQKYRFEAVTKQKLNEFTETVIKEGEIDNPLAFEAPKLINAEYRAGVLELTLDREVNNDWVVALGKMGNFSAVMGRPPESFDFVGNKARVRIDASSAQKAIDHFKEWLPKATTSLKCLLEQEILRKKFEEEERLRRLREEEERTLKLNNQLRV